MGRTTNRRGRAVRPRGQTQGATAPARSTSAKPRTVGARIAVEQALVLLRLIIHLPGGPRHPPCTSRTADQAWRVTR